MKEVVLYFGSFNPVHRGHTAVAGYVLDVGLCDELWFVVSPQNPLKSASDLLPDEDRLEMVCIAVREELGGRNVRVSDVEFSLPKPSYTVDTLEVLKAGNPQYRFSLLFGADVLSEVPLWKDYRRILSENRIIVYPRGGSCLPALPVLRDADLVYLENAPVWDFSSTDVRDALRHGGAIEDMVSRGVAEYIKRNELWKSIPK